MKEVEAEVKPPKIKTGKVKKLLKTVESKATEVEGNKLIKNIETKIKKKKDISDIKQMLKQSEIELIEPDFEVSISDTMDVINSTTQSWVFYQFWVKWM
jgi:hypothetical protein